MQTPGTGRPHATPLYDNEVRRALYEQAGFRLGHRAGHA